MTSSGKKTFHKRLTSLDVAAYYFKCSKKEKNIIFNI